MKKFKLRCQRLLGTRLDTRLPQSRAGGQLAGAVIEVNRSFGQDHRSSEAKKKTQKPKGASDTSPSHVNVLA